MVFFFSSNNWKNCNDHFRYKIFFRLILSVDEFKISNINFSSKFFDSSIIGYFHPVWVRIWKA